MSWEQYFSSTYLSCNQLTGMVQEDLNSSSTMYQLTDQVCTTHRFVTFQFNFIAKEKQCSNIVLTWIYTTEVNTFCCWLSLRNCCIQCLTTCWICFSQQLVCSYVRKKTPNHWWHDHSSLCLTLLLSLCDPFLYLLPRAQLFNYTTRRGLKDTLVEFQQKQDAYKALAFRTRVEEPL